MDISLYDSLRRYVFMENALVPQEFVPNVPGHIHTDGEHLEPERNSVEGAKNW